MNDSIKLKPCFIVCWFGPFPKYFSIWLQTVRYNLNFDFLIFTDNEEITKYSIPKNVKVKKLTLSEFQNRAEQVLHQKCNLERPYRICDFRPMFGLIFKKELSKYDFWGYCDLDLVFGKIDQFVTLTILNKYDAIFNGGHFTLIKNSPKMNNLFRKKGGAFNYHTVINHDATFAFDETTGIQQIAKKNNVNAIYSIPYVDADVKYFQLRSVFDKENPNYQCFYWENGKLYRTKIQNDNITFENITYIHLQKRPILLKSPINELKNSFWITPNGFEEKVYLGEPSREDVKEKNPYLGKINMDKELKKYKFKKIKEILSRSPFKIYVRIIQAKNGINDKQGTISENQWKKY